MLQKTKAKMDVSSDVSAHGGELGGLLSMWAVLAAEVEEKMTLDERQVLLWSLTFHREKRLSFLEAICELCEKKETSAADPITLEVLAREERIRIFQEYYTDHADKYTAERLAEKIAANLREKVECKKS